MKVWMLAAVVAGGLLATSARAQWVVFDPSNYAQNVLQVVRQAEQIAKQIEALENQATMIQNQLKNLEPLGFNILERLRANLATTERLLAHDHAITFSPSIVEPVFASQYPLEYPQWTSREQMAFDAHLRWTNSLEALRTTVLMQAQARQNLNDDESSLSDLVVRSQGATGNLDTAQATNQILALLAKQAIEEQRLRIAEDRSVALESARGIVAADKSRELRRRFMTRETAYTPEPIGLGQ